MFIEVRQNFVQPATFDGEHSAKKTEIENYAGNKLQRSHIAKMQTTLESWQEEK